MVGNNSIRIPLPTFGIACFLPLALRRPSSPTSRAGTYRDLANHRADPNLDCIFGISVVELVGNRSVATPSVASLTRRLVLFSPPDSGSARHCPSWFYHLFPNFWKRRFQIRFCAIHSSSSFGESFYSSLFGWAQFPSYFGPPQIQPHIFNFGDLSLGDHLPLSKSNLRLCVLYLVNSWPPNWQFGVWLVELNFYFCDCLLI